MQKSEILKTIGLLKPVHWILIETQDGLRRRGKFLMADKEFLHIHEQRVMATGLIFEGKTGQVPQMIRTKVEISKISILEKATARGQASGSKATKK